MSPRRALLVIAAVMMMAPILVALTAVAAESSPSRERTVRMHHSRFLPGALTVRAGQAITFTIRNDDPIEHEWLIGDDAMHERHRHGTEAVHDTRPDEVTVPAYSTRVTTLRFDTPGDYAYICHLPGHEEYGMRGTLHVVAD